MRKYKHIIKLLQHVLLIIKYLSHTSKFQPFTTVDYSRLPQSDLRILRAIIIVQHSNFEVSIFSTLQHIRRLVLLQAFFLLL